MSQVKQHEEDGWERKSKTYVHDSEHHLWFFVIQKLKK